MKQAVIDIGSNSIRLTLYETENRDFKILFREKIMAGLAGYVEDGKLSAEGIECACMGLLTFRGVLQTLDIEHVSVFATASLRNISNTEQALSLIRAATGYSVQVVSGEEEALLGYAGAMRELHLTGGVFLDIGGADELYQLSCRFAESIPPLRQKDTARRGLAQTAAAGNRGCYRGRLRRAECFSSASRCRRYSACGAAHVAVLL